MSRQKLQGGTFLKDSPVDPYDSKIMHPKTSRRKPRTFGSSGAAPET